jgi:hypothetical protein
MEQEQLLRPELAERQGSRSLEHNSPASQTMERADSLVVGSDDWFPQFMEQDLRIDNTQDPDPEPDWPEFSWPTGNHSSLSRDYRSDNGILGTLQCVGEPQSPSLSMLG